MTVGVVIPLYNHERYIGDALRSVLMQELAPDRIVIVDDGSSDGSVTAVRKFDDPRILLIEQENGGAHTALNRGILQASDCDLIAILNSDDIYHRERLARCVSHLEDKPGLEMVVTGLRIIDENARELPPDHPKARRSRSVWAAREFVVNPAEWLGIANFAKTSSNFVVRRDFLLSHPFKNYRYTHDYFLAAFAAMHNQLGVLEATLLSYRVHGTNTIKSDSNDKVTRETIRLNLELLKRLHPSLRASQAVRENYARYMRRLAENYSDFRFESFLAALSETMGDVPEHAIRSILDSMTAECFQELAEPTPKVLREKLAIQELQTLEATLSHSRWYLLGRALGKQPEVFDREEPSASLRLSGARKALKQSGWLRIGRRLGIESDY